MVLRHVALQCCSEKNSDRFYQSLLGLTKLNAKTLPAEIANTLFHVNSEIPVVNYGNDELWFEIFIRENKPADSTPIAHVCLAVADRPSFIEKCRSMEIEIRQVARGDGVLVIVCDYDGNLFEIKEAQG